MKPRAPHVLIVAYHFPPESSIGTFRTLRLVRHLAEQAWNVTVLTGTPETYSSGCSIDVQLLAKVPANVRVVRAPVLRPWDRLVSALRPRGRRDAAAASFQEATIGNAGVGALSRLRRAVRFAESLLGIPDQHVGWLLPAVAKGVTACAGQRPDVIYSTAPPWSGQLVARALVAFFGCPWVADFRDPWARAPWREGRPALARRVAQLMERAVIRRAGSVVFTTRTNLDEFGAFYGDAVRPKFHLVRNGCDDEEFAGLAPLTRDRRFTLLHAGSLYGGRRPTALFNALAALAQRGVITRESFCFRQIGRVGLGGFDMRAESTRLGLDGMVELVDSQPRPEVLREMLGASCLLLLQPGTTVSIPGKLFEYVAASRPILAIAEEGELSDLVRATGCGLAARPDDQGAIEEAIEALVRSPLPLNGGPRLDLFDGRLRTRELAGVIDATCQRRFVASQPYEVTSK